MEERNERDAPELQLVRLDHAPALLAFERENRAYFAAVIPDRGTSSSLSSTRGTRNCSRRSPPGRITSTCW
ncbi:hypothetical protein KSX_04610 [Ktedonospora formicarum]|uniref:Uncharacterized protein n=1 Tax=Ktedonospora formicarum TaxID=2778364 RepID=A0A8J3MQ62_9CHLR|nr:hypothetical protein KSX_04610 [Ktedonospora formicarum]